MLDIFPKWNYMKRESDGMFYVVLESYYVEKIGDDMFDSALELN